MNFRIFDDQYKLQQTCKGARWKIIDDGLSYTEWQGKIPGLEAKLWKGKTVSLHDDMNGLSGVEIHRFLHPHTRVLLVALRIASKRFRGRIVIIERRGCRRIYSKPKGSR